mmetsp:Transcript_28628/g.42504  ORF Transcript_28628/g.42504 Transcript_28628/m.42504 type:complete len:1156 (-) Transcript_28628:42-3509(-)
MPALDIADEAFDLLFYTYLTNRHKWLRHKNNNDDDDDGNDNNNNNILACDHPYLTNAGSITSGKRLEHFLQALGNHETPYYDNKKRTEFNDNERMRKADAKAGRPSSIPSEEDLKKREEIDRRRYGQMLDGLLSDGSESEGSDEDEKELEEAVFRAANTAGSPVTSAREINALRPSATSIDYNANSSDTTTSNGATTTSTSFKPEAANHGLDDGFFSRLGSLLKNSLSTSGRGGDGNHQQHQGTSSSSNNNLSFMTNSTNTTTTMSKEDERRLTDLKGRYYYDKFQFTPLDFQSHYQLRKSYIEGLLWNLQYYYKGCVSWEWYYPYHYGPMLSDLVDVDEMLSEISFDDKLGEPLKPYEQLMGCLPPSSAYLLPKPYRWLMKDKTSPIKEFYPESFTVDMNGKRWPWEAVVLLPFIDSERLIGSARSLVKDDMLTEEERRRNEPGDVIVLTHDESLVGKTVAPMSIAGKDNETSEALPGLECFGAITECKAREELYNKTQWNHDENIQQKALFKPELMPGAKVPYPGFPTLKEAPVEGLFRRKIGIDIFGMRSRYRTAVLQMDEELPAFPPPSVLGPKFIGTTVFFRYPFLQEGFVTAVSDAKVTARGLDPPRRWTKQEELGWKLRRDSIQSRFQSGEGRTGSGGWMCPESNVMLSIRPLKGLKIIDGKPVKVYAKVEVEVPLAAALWSPSKPDPRFANVPALLEKNPYNIPSKSARKSDLLSNVLTEEETQTKAPMLDEIFGDSQSSTIAATATDPLLPHHKSADQVPAARGKTLLPDFPGSNTKPDISNAAKGARLLPDFPESNPGGTSGDGGNAAPLLSAQSGLRGFSTNTSALKSLENRRNPLSHTKRSFATQTAMRKVRSGNPRTRAVTAVAIAAASFFSAGVGYQTNAETIGISQFPLQPSILSQNIVTSIRGGGESMHEYDISEEGNSFSPPSPPPLEFAHGTTTLSFTFQGGIIVAVDSRASIGNFVGSKTTQKVLPVNKNILGTMAGGAADCSFWIRRLRSEAKLHELSEGKPISVARASRFLSSALYQNRHLDLSVGTMIMGYDSLGASIYYVDNTGVRIKGDMFAAGSGSTFALGILDTERRYEMTQDEAITLGIKAIRHATFRDAYSGGYIGVYLVTKHGWKKVFSEDLALSVKHYQKDIVDE